MNYNFSTNHLNCLLFTSLKRVNYDNLFEPGVDQFEAIFAKLHQKNHFGCAIFMFERFRLSIILPQIFVFNLVEDNKEISDIVLFLKSEQ